MRRLAPSHPCVLMLAVAYAICGAARQHPESGVVDGTESARALVEQARRLHQPQEVALKVDLLQRAAVSRVASSAEARELALATVQILLNTRRVPEASLKQILHQSVAAVDRYRQMTMEEAPGEASEQQSHVCNALVSFGHQLEGMDRPTMALDIYMASLRLDPTHVNSRASLFKVREWLCDWNASSAYAGREKAFREIMAIVAAQLAGDDAAGPAGIAVQTALQPLTALSQDVDASMQRRIARAWSLAYVALSRGAHDQRTASRHRNHMLTEAGVARPIDGRLNVAYISGDLRGHAVSHLMKLVLRQHATSKRVRPMVLNTWAGSVGSDGAEIKGYVQTWVDVAGNGNSVHAGGGGGVGDQGLAAMIANTMRVHILVDLAGHTGGHRMGVLARRPAPVSVTFLGFAATTGADFIDYIVSDALVSPPELACEFSESIGMIPPTMYPVNTEQAVAAPMPTRRQLGLPAEVSRAFVLACFNRNLKIKPDVWAVWMKLLQARQRSVLWLRRFHIQVQENLVRQAAAANVSTSRLIFAGRIPDRAMHLSRHGQADLFLDTPRFGGHSTLVDVLWAGRPALVVPGATMASRIGASLLMAAGGRVMVARGMEEYLALALALSDIQHQDALEAIGARISAALHAPDSRVRAEKYSTRLEGWYALTWEAFRIRRQDARASVAMPSSTAKASAAAAAKHKASVWWESLDGKAPPVIYTRMH